MRCFFFSLFFFLRFMMLCFLQILLVSLLGNESTAYDFGKRGGMGRLEGKDMAGLGRDDLGSLL